MESTNSKYLIQWVTHPKLIFKGLCTLLEHQSLVDIVISCGTNILHAHKCVLAASSPYFREQFERSNINQIIVNGLDFAVMKSLIEFMYCGETAVADVHIKYFIAAAKLFQLDVLEGIFAENEQHMMTAEEVCIPQPQFLCKSPKYSTTINPFNLQMKTNYALKNSYNQYRIKNKRLRVEAEKACDKEAQASTIALSNLHKVLANEAQGNSFIVEESCTETTVENFIPHDEDSDGDNLQSFPLTDTEPCQDISETKPTDIHSLSNDDSVKSKSLIERDIEILFQTSDGEIVNFTEDVAHNFSKSEVQYRVVDEHGNLGQPQELQVLDIDTVHKIQAQQNGNDEDDAQTSSEIDKIAKTVPEEYIDPNFQSNIAYIKQLPSMDSNSNKENYETLIMHSSFEDRLYDIHGTTSEISEPENLTIRAHVVEDSPFQFDTLNFNRSDTDSTLNKLIDLSCNGVESSTNSEIVELGNAQSNFKGTCNLLTMKNNQTELANEKTIIFEPGMFFFDLTGSDDDRSKNITNNN